MNSKPATKRGSSRRRGSALILVLLLTVTLAAVALSAITMMSSGVLLGDYYDRESDFRYAAEAGLAMGKAQLSKDTTLVVPDSGYVTLISGGTIIGADGLAVPRVRVNVYVGKSGNSTGQFGQFASVVSEAYDVSGTRYVRRLELQAENFARFAMFTNHWPGVCYATGEFIRGRGHSNENWQSCGVPIYFDTISAHGAAIGGAPDYRKGHIDGAPFISIPPVTKLAIIHTRAVDGNLDIISQGTNAGNVRTRLEFVAIDIDNDGTLNGANEGFFRVYQGNNSNEVRADPTGTHGPDDQCGDWHMDSVSLPAHLEFYPVSVHDQVWFKNRFGSVHPTDTVTGGTNPNERDKIMQNPGFRCYPRGDPHLVATERLNKLSLPAPVPADWQKGGEDTTFTDSTTFGFWQQWGGPQANVTAALAAIPGGAPAEGYKQQDKWLWPLFKGINPGAHGAIHVHGPIAVNGVLRGKATLYAQTFGGQHGEVVYVDDVVYAQDPSAVLCANLFGVLSDGQQTIADNAINSPQRASGGKPYRWSDGNDNGMLTANDFVFHGVMMSRTGTIAVENFGAHPENLKHCGAANSGRGCIRQAGGVIQDNISATFTNSGDGYGENRSVDQCMTQESPPYFPVTGRYLDNRFYEMDPARFNVTTLFQSLQSGM
jgi:hypothetical protein